VLQPARQGRCASGCAACSLDRRQPNQEAGPCNKLSSFSASLLSLPTKPRFTHPKPWPRKTLPPTRRPPSASACSWCLHRGAHGRHTQGCGTEHSAQRDGRCAA
jgi:hypothetical protein